MPNPAELFSVGSEITELSIAELKQFSERLLGIPAPEVMTKVVEGTAGSAPEDSEVWLYPDGVAPPKIMQEGALPTAAAEATESSLPQIGISWGLPDVIANAAPAETVVGRATFDSIPNLGWTPAELAAKEERETALAALYRPGAPYLR